MNEKMVNIYDTTLRDGEQAEEINFSADDKILIAAKLDQLGVNYIEGGWPGSKPKDKEFFEKAKLIKFNNSKRHSLRNTPKPVRIQAFKPYSPPRPRLLRSWVRLGIFRSGKL